MAVLCEAPRAVFQAPETQVLALREPVLRGRYPYLGIYIYRYSKKKFKIDICLIYCLVRLCSEIIAASRLTSSRPQSRQQERMHREDAVAATQHKENELHLNNYALAHPSNYQEKSTSKRCK